MNEVEILLVQIDIDCVDDTVEAVRGILRGLLVFYQIKFIGYS
jgi:hypothetical protein